MTVNSRVIKVFLGWSPDAVDVPLMNGLRVQILPTIEDLPRARKHQFAAFVASEALLVVWDDDALHLIQRAKAIESELMELVWQTGEPEEVEDGSAKKGPTVNEVEIDQESGNIMPQNRPTHLLNTILVAFTLILIVTVLGAGFRELAIEVAVDHSYLRLAFVALTPVQIFFTLVDDHLLEFMLLTANRYCISFLPKWLLVASHNALVPYAKWRRIPNFSLHIARPVSRIVPYLMLQFNALCTKKVYTPSLCQPSSPSNRLSRHMNFRVVLRTCLSMTTDCNLFLRKNDERVLTSMPTTRSDGLRAPSMV